jgi:hypothetical protein
MCLLQEAWKTDALEDTIFIRPSTCFIRYRLIDFRRIWCRASAVYTACRTFFSFVSVQYNNYYNESGHFTPLSREFKSNTAFHMALKHKNALQKVQIGYNITKPITVATRSKVWTVFSRSNTRVVGSNPFRGMDVCPRFSYVCVVLRVGSGLATGWSPVQVVLGSV